MKKGKRKQVRDKITFADDWDATALALAELGMSTKFIRYTTGLTECQITYRLSKAKRLMSARVGFRVAWRNGTSPIALRVMGDMTGVLVRDAQRDLPKLITHPTPEVVSK